MSKWLIFVAVFALVGCTSSAGDSSQPTVTSTMSTTTVAPTTGGSGEPSIAMEDVAASMQAIIDQEYETSDPPEGVTGPSRLECRDSGLVQRGTVFACSLWPQADPELGLEPVGVVAYVTDDEGTVAWVVGTDMPDRAEYLERAYDASPKGLYCRDLAGSEHQSWFNTGDQGPAGYVLALVYWALEGQPDRMDLDRNGVPCETVFDADVVQEVLAGGPMS